jgi:regulator of protease activity HflC (stomatin/prohibitin superfamily)
MKLEVILICAALSLYQVQSRAVGSNVSQKHCELNAYVGSGEVNLTKRGKKMRQRKKARKAGRKTARNIRKDARKAGRAIGGGRARRNAKEAGRKEGRKAKKEARKQGRSNAKAAKKQKHELENKLNGQILDEAVPSFGDDDEDKVMDPIDTLNLVEIEDWSN